MTATYAEWERANLAEVERWRELGGGPVGRHEHPWVHVAADHDVRIFFPDWYVGYVGLVDGVPDITDTKGTEAGDTDSAWCETCGARFDPEVLGL